MQETTPHPKRQPQRHSVSRWWGMALCLCMTAGCASNAEQAKAQETSALIDRTPTSSKEPSYEEFKPKDATPLWFEPGTFSWQPQGTTIVVHTALGALEHYFEKQSAAANFILAHGLGVHVKLDEITQSTSPLDDTQRIWVAVDVPELRLNEQLHFYEISTGRADTPSEFSRTGPFRWTPHPDFMVRSAIDELHIYIKHLPGGRVILGEDEGTSVDDPPRVKEPWSSWAVRCRDRESAGCTAQLIVWRPAQGVVERFDAQVTTNRIDHVHIEDTYPSMVIHALE